MKPTLVCLWAASALLLLACPAVGQRKSPIYQKGWIDFNKNGRKDIYEDPTQPLEKRLDDLIAQMTLEEKTCQLATLYGYSRVLKDELPTPEWKEQIWKDGIANIDEHLNGLAYHPKAATPYSFPYAKHTEALNTIQRWFIEETRLGIPVDFSNEGIHGLCHDRATSFPAPIAIGHTWNKDLVRRMGEIVGREGKVLGYTNIYAPILDLARDPRWGRVVECYGEDPYLVGALGKEMVLGIQSQGVAATVKHFAVYSVPKGGRDGLARTDPHVSPREMHQMHLAPFKKVITEADALGVMSSYNDYDGEPITASHFFLSQLLRQQWGFRGYVVSDSEAVEYVYSKHKVVNSYEEATRAVLTAGLNVRTNFSEPKRFIEPVRASVRSGHLSIEVIDRAVRDVLRVKMLVGLFDQPFNDPKLADRQVRTPEAIATARQMSREAMVLLKNENDFLPLDKNKLNTMLVVGPLAKAVDPFVSRYGPSNYEVITLLEGIRRQAPGLRIEYALGCEIADENWPDTEVLPDPVTAAEEALMAEAVQKAQGVDVIVVTLGDGLRTVGESTSRTDLNLTGRQEMLLKALHATGKPLCLVLVNGRPVTINWADRHVPAILQAWFQGEYVGEAVAATLFGDYNPGGKLTVTYPKTVGQIEYNFPYKPAAHAAQPQYGANGTGRSRVLEPLYHFGHGLSYTTFAYDNLQISPERQPAGGQFTVRLTVTNTGSRAGDEVVQLYINDEISSVTTYLQQLRGFERIHLQPGQSREVSFVLRPDDLALLDRQMNWVVEPGKFNVWVGGGSEDIRLRGSFHVGTSGASQAETGQ